MTTTEILNNINDATVERLHCMINELIHHAYELGFCDGYEKRKYSVYPEKGERVIECLGEFDRETVLAIINSRKGN